MDILVFGDSIAEGLWDSHGGWVDRLKTVVHENEIESQFTNYHELYNLGIDGNTTRQTLDRFDSETKARRWPDSELGFIFAIGINDTLHRNGIDFECTPAQYAFELTALLEKAKAYSNKVLFVDLTPVDEAKTNPVASSSTGKCYTNQRIDEFNRELHKSCKVREVRCVRVSKAFKAENVTTFLATDGLHPNDEGHRIIYELTLPQLMEWLQ